MAQLLVHWPVFCSRECMMCFRKSDWVNHLLLPPYALTQNYLQTRFMNQTSSVHIFFFVPFYSPLWISLTFSVFDYIFSSVPFILLLKHDIYCVIFLLFLPFSSCLIFLWFQIILFMLLITRHFSLLILRHIYFSNLSSLFYMHIILLYSIYFLSG